MEAKKRLRKVINWLIYQEIAENDSALAELLGYKKSSFSQIVNGAVPLSDKFIERLCSLDENINDVWIKTGEGDMFIDGSQISQRVYGDNNNVAGRDINLTSSDVEKLINTISEQQRSISVLVETNQQQMNKFTELLQSLINGNKQ